VTIIKKEIIMGVRSSRQKLEGKVNLTLLDPYTLADKNGPIHRDYLAHCFRWAFVGKLIKRGYYVLDIGAGTGNLAETLYRNRIRPGYYAAVELKESYLKELTELSKAVNFVMNVFKKDIRKDSLPLIFEELFDVVCCFEVIEHFESYWDKPDYLSNLLSEMKRACKADGRILLSTPNYDGIHKAKNHVYEYREDELESILLKHGFKIERKYGTFMNLGRPEQAKRVLTQAEFEVYQKLYSYYNSSILSVMFAPLHPSESRNILWVLKK